MDPYALALWMVQKMGLDNNCTFAPGPDDFIALVAGVGFMQTQMQFTEEDVMQITCGEITETREKYQDILGYDMVDEALNHIFDEAVVQ